MDSVWSRSGDQGDKWYQAQVAVNNQTASYQYVIEGVRGKGIFGNIAIDDISVMDSCPPRDKGTTDDSSRIIIIATTVGAGVFLSIVLIVLLVKYKRRKRASKLTTPVNIPLETNETSPEPLPVDEEAVYETVQNVDREFYEDVAANANESEDISAEGRTSYHEEVEVPSNAHQASGHTELNKRPDTLKRGATGDGDYQALLKEDGGYVIPASEEPQHETPCQNENCEEPKLSPENPVYTELDVNGRNTTEDGSYQKLVKQDSDYVIPAHKRRESYEDICVKMGRNLPDYTELDQSKRETDNYQKLVKTELVEGRAHAILFEFQASTTREMACLKAKAKEKYLQYIFNEYRRFLSWKYFVIIVKSILDNKIVSSARCSAFTSFTALYKIVERKLEGVYEMDTKRFTKEFSETKRTAKEFTFDAIYVWK
ncbi:MAM domain-containing glycosylphosphatidylinositol anchor 2-like [Paramuricea clavata]|nr:MAM domain-containing glycosylphosphatidylinositol anchor 2-like [Paramuricea clavata]